MAERLPTEMIVAVLCRVPVKDLLRCRAVCKQWRALLDGPDFIKMHLDHQRRRSDHQDSLHELESGVKLIIGDNNMVGSCHGLVAVAGFEGEFSLLNPSIRRFRMLPTDHDYYPEMTQVVVYGFGYDAVNDDDFKLVTVAQPHPYLEPEAKFETEVKVYSAKTDSWKRTTIDHGYGSSFHLLSEGFETGNGFPLANALHWVASRKLSRETHRFNDLVIASFDLATEEFREMTGPDCDDLIPRETSELGIQGDVVRGCVCLVFSDLRSHFEIWLMREYGVKESWTKLFRVDPSPPRFSFVDTHRELDMMSGCVLTCEMDGRVALYDVERERVENMWTVNSSLELQAQACIESLVGLAGYGWRQAEEYSPRRAEELGVCPFFLGSLFHCLYHSL